MGSALPVPGDARLALPAAPLSPSGGHQPLLPVLPGRPGRRAPRARQQLRGPSADAAGPQLALLGTAQPLEPRDPLGLAARYWGPRGRCPSRTGLPGTRGPGVHSWPCGHLRLHVLGLRDQPMCWAAARPSWPPRAPCPALSVTTTTSWSQQPCWSLCVNEHHVQGWPRLCVQSPHEEAWSPSLPQGWVDVPRPLGCGHLAAAGQG